MAVRSALLIPPGGGPVRRVNIEGDFARALGCASVEGYSVDHPALERLGYALSLFVDEFRRNQEPNPRASALVSRRLGPARQLVGPALLVDDEKDLSLADVNIILATFS
jgi:hypothetical protein